MTTGLVIFGCPTRILLRAGYGELYGLVALAGMAAGITASTLLVRWAGRTGLTLPMLRAPRPRSAELRRRSAGASRGEAGTPGGSAGRTPFGPAASAHRPPREAAP